MPTVTGPTIARWQLGEELTALRRSMGLAWDEVAEHLSCSEAKVRRIEKGEVGVVKAELVALLDLYKVDDTDHRERLLNLQRLGKQRGWWTKLGGVPVPYAEYLGIESAASMIRTFEAHVAPGLLQTEGYTRALVTGVRVSPDSHPTITSPGYVERLTQIRYARQDRFFAGDHDRRLWAVIDETVLRRPIGSAEVMAEQVEHLVRMSARCTIQVLPMKYGAHPGLYGPFAIFEFPEDLHSPVAYVECQAGNLYLEKSEDLSRCKLAFDHMTAAALSPPDSTALLQAVADEWTSARKDRT